MLTFSKASASLIVWSDVPSSSRGARGPRYSSEGALPVEGVAVAGGPGVRSAPLTAPSPRAASCLQPVPLSSWHPVRLFTLRKEIIEKERGGGAERLA